AATALSPASSRKPVFRVRRRCSSFSSTAARTCSSVAVVRLSASYAPHPAVRKGACASAVEGVVRAHAPAEPALVQHHRGLVGCEDEVLPLAADMQGAVRPFL